MSDRAAGETSEGKLRSYLGSLRYSLRLEQKVEAEVVQELSDHLQDRAEEMEAAGLSPEEAGLEAVLCLGSPQLIARQVYEAHSQGSWWQTVLAASPHVLFALLFALNWWHDILWVLVLLGAVVSFSIYGWWRGKPGWLFPWLGYLLVPVIVAGALLLYLPRAWSWVAILCYLPLALWLLLCIGRQSLKTDWLYCSLMMLPVPVLASWVLALRWRELLLYHNGSPVYGFAPWIAVSFVALGVAAAAFVRLRQRRLKAGALLASGLSVVVLVGL
ncbi:MAG: permease prefix domain 1-containing protein, partial [Chloroflexota bacterium]